ncbi:MAG: glycosyltransferase [Bacteroidota bacterium]
MEKRRAIVSVINDLYSDRRVDKTCRLLAEKGFDVVLLGRLLPGSPPMDARPYHTHRFTMIFEEGILMYLEFQLRLLIWMLTHKGHLFWSNDLDTVLPAFLTGRLRKFPVIQDSHEYFTGAPELLPYPWKQKVWKRLEQFCYPRVDELITVNESIARRFRSEYRRNVYVVRNIPDRIDITPMSRAEGGLPGEGAMLILQGAGINVDRGAEELIEAMQYIDNAFLLILGDGDVIPQLKKRVKQLKLRQRVIFKGRMEYRHMMQYTRLADLGFSLDKPISENYRLSLPNKVFDYIHAATPLIVSAIPEVMQLVRHYDIGDIVENHQPEIIAQTIQQALSNKERYQQWQNNLTFAAKELQWKQEKKVLEERISQYV